jgi:hypothetical protein
MAEPISKYDKLLISRADSVWSFWSMVNLVASYHSQEVGAFPHTLVLAICWEESYFQNIPQYGGGPAVGFGQLEVAGRRKAYQHSLGRYDIFEEGFFTRDNILQSPPRSMQAVSHCLAGLYCDPQMGHSVSGALDAYAGVRERAENQPIPGRWWACANNLTNVLLYPTYFTPVQIEDALRLARAFPRSGPVYDHIHAKLWPMWDILSAIESTLRSGSSGAQVSYLQEGLNMLTSNDPWSGGGSLELKVDGLFGPKTEARVKTFQKRNNLVADGVVGPKTRAALLAQAGTA